MALNVNTSYGPGRDVTTSGGFTGPSAGGGSDLRSLLERLARRNVGNQLRQTSRERAPSQATGPSPARRERPAPPRMNPDAGKIPMFTKQLTGFNMSGTVKAEPWERGAAFAGYAPPGYSPYPNNASIVSEPGRSPASLSPEPRARPEVVDPFPHGTGAAFEEERFRSARARSDREAESRQALADAMRGMR